MSFNPSVYQDVLKVIDQHQHFLVSSHINPDGDCLCSQLALALVLRYKGKKIHILNDDQVPGKFSFLPHGRLIETEMISSFPYEVVFVLDASNPERTGSVYPKVYSPDIVVINIDHHGDNSFFGNYNIVNEKASSTGEILYDFFRQTHLPVDAAVAEYIYISILTDTGCFQNRTLSSDLFRTCSELLAFGVDHLKIYQNIYHQQLPEKLLFEAAVMANLQLYNNNRVCVLELPQQMSNDQKFRYDFTDGLAEKTVTLKGVEVGVFLKHFGDEVRVNLRSGGRVDVSKIARAFAGGGHPGAAGCSFKTNLQEAKHQILEEINRNL